MPHRVSPLRLLPAFLATTLALLLGVAPGRAQEETPEKGKGLTLESITVSPSTPGPGTLVQLRVDIANAGEKIASQLAFRVGINGQELPVYGNQIFMQALPPGETTEVRLYNFWTTETFRPLPADQKLSLEVALTEAHWYRIEDVEEDGEAIEEWTPLEPVPGLPSSRSLVLDLSKGPAGPYADLEGDGAAQAKAPSAPEGDSKEDAPDRR